MLLDRREHAPFRTVLVSPISPVQSCQGESSLYPTVHYRRCVRSLSEYSASSSLPLEHLHGLEHYSEAWERQLRQKPSQTGTPKEQL
jgi:hypothetical protein